MDSDSSDEILPSQQKLEDLFSRKIRSPQPPKPSSSAHKLLRNPYHNEASSANILIFQSAKTLTMDSDSSDEILPSQQKLEDLFSRKIRSPQPPKPSSSAHKDTTRTAPTGTASAKKENIKKKFTPEISDDTRKFLAELDEDDIGVMKPIPTSTTTSGGNSTASSTFPSPSVALVPIPKSPKQSRSTRGRQGSPPTKRSKPDKKSETMEVSSSNETPREVLCTIQRNGEIHHFKMSQGSRISQIRMLLAEKFDANPDSLLILNEDMVQVPEDEMVGSFPFGVTMEVFKKEENQNENVSLKTLKPGFIRIHLQGGGGYRQRFPVTIRKTTHMKQAVDDYIEKFGFQGKNFRLELDGDTLDLTETPESLDLENNVMIDIVEEVPK